MKWQAVIHVGHFGRTIYYPPRRWKWIAKWWDANNFIHLRTWWYEIIQVEPATCKVGTFIRHDDGYEQSL